MIGPGRVRDDDSLDRGPDRALPLCGWPGIYDLPVRDRRVWSGFSLSVDVLHNYLIEASSNKENWTLLESSVQLLGREIRDHSNRGWKDFDLTPFLQDEADSVYFRLRDPSPDDGWGPVLVGMKLNPVYKAGDGPAQDEPSLNLRDSYCIAYQGLDPSVTTLMQSGDGLPVIFSATAGTGKSPWRWLFPRAFRLLGECGRRRCGKSSGRYAGSGRCPSTRMARFT